MKKILIVLAIIALAITTADAQKVVMVQSDSTHELRMISDTLRLVTIETIRATIVAPQPKKGFVKSDQYGQSADTVRTEHKFVQIEKSFWIKNQHSKEFDYFSPNYYDAMNTYPDKKVYSPSGNKEFTKYSNYFFTKETGEIYMYVIYHAKAKVPYFELGMDKKSETSTPWLSLIFAFIVLSFCGRAIARFCLKYEIFKQKSFVKKIEGWAFFILITFLANFILLGIVFEIFLSSDNYGHIGMSFNQELIVWFVRYAILLAFCFIWHRNDRKDFLTEADEKPNSVTDTAAGSETLDQ